MGQRQDKSIPSLLSELGLPTKSLTHTKQTQAKQPRVGTEQKDDKVTNIIMMLLSIPGGLLNMVSFLS